MSTWKAVERRIAKILGGVRVPITGRTRGSTPDIEHDTLSLEVKHRKKYPDWLHDAMDQAIQSQKENQIPTVVLHQERRPHDEDYVIFRLGDLKHYDLICKTDDS